MGDMYVEARGYTVKLAHAKLLANADNISCWPHVKRPHMQFTCVICSLPVKTGTFNFYLSLRGKQLTKNTRELLQQYVTLPEYCGYFTSNLNAELMQICLSPARKTFCFRWKKNKKNAIFQAKSPAIVGKNTRNRRQKHPQLQAKHPQKFF